MRILVAEDDSVTRSLLRVSLERWHYEATLTSNGAEALEILLGNDAPKLAILDWVMPGADGVDICRDIRKRELASYIYILLLTSKASREDLLNGLQAGADDYLIKPFDLLELQARLWSGERIIALQDQLIAARETMREQATHDALTGVWNRAGILELLESEFNRSCREENHLSVIMADLDHFKQINDTLGHQAGDAVLREVTRSIRSCLRPYDALGRCGGEEFLVVAPGCDESSSSKLAERIRNCIAAGAISTPYGLVSVTLSLGVATLDDDRDLESLIRRADNALYHAKNIGRNRVEAA